MFWNYLKIALKLLWRKKFFTGVSLFGISFTLMVLTLLIAFLHNELGSNPPLSRSDRLVFLTSARMTLERSDTLLQVDTSYVDGVQVLDSVITTANNVSSVSTSNPSYYFLNKYLRALPFAENQSFYSVWNQIDLFVKEQKLVLMAGYTDANYWEIFDFQFLEGGAFGRQAVEDQQPVVVINEKTRDAYFGKGAEAVGRDMVIQQKHYRVIGVTKNVTRSNDFNASDVFFPLSHLPAAQLNYPDFLGNFEAVFLAAERDQVPLIKAELKVLEAAIPMPNPEEYNQLELTVSTTRERYARGLIYEDDPADSLRMFYGIFGLAILLFILLPTLNLVNINITRILERSSEIGVRKAFGANTGNLLVQFLFENVVITALGGLIGFALSLLAIYLINTSEVFPQTTLKFNGVVFFLGLLVTLVFGIVSGWAPARKMSRISIVQALKTR